MIAKAQRLFHTVRYLKLKQLAALARTRVRGAVYAEGSNLPLRPRRQVWQEGLHPLPSMFGPTTFRFLNEERTLAFPEGWAFREASDLWLYHLHYFDDLNAETNVQRAAWHRSLIAQWLSDHPRGAGLGWHPYPISRRIVNWVKWALRGNTLSLQAIESLVAQVRTLRGCLEYHLLGNHLLANAKALVFAGLFFESEEAERWRFTGEQVLRDELAEQVLADGGHYERSPMYHAIVLEDLLDLINLKQVYGSDVPAGWRALVNQMLQWLATMSHPDGEISFFNDSAIGNAGTYAELAAYAGRLGMHASHEVRSSGYLQESGYVRIERGTAVLMADVGPVGPDCQPGHAHADTLSFELSLDGSRLLVNSGTSVYGTGPERARQRGTAAHNAVVVDRSDSSEVWAGFRVARRARVFDIEVRETEAAAQITALHDGYRRLSGSPLHRRTWTLSGEDLTITDHLLGGGLHEVHVPFHLHPAAQVQSLDARGAVLDHQGKRIEVLVDGLLPLALEDSTYHPGFGKQVASQRLVLAGEVTFPVEVKTTFRWAS